MTNHFSFDHTPIQYAPNIYTDTASFAPIKVCMSYTYANYIVNPELFE